MTFLTLRPWTPSAIEPSASTWPHTSRAWATDTVWCSTARWAGTHTHTDTHGHTVDAIKQAREGLGEVGGLVRLQRVLQSLLWATHTYTHTRYHEHRWPFII